MNKKIILWIAALVITFLTAFLHQRLSPYYPVSGSIGINGNRITYVFPKVHYGPGTTEIFIRKEISGLDGMLYRRSGKSAWDSIKLQDEDKYLKASVQPLKTGTVAEYYSELTYESNHYRIPANSNVSIVYKGNRPASVMNVLYFFLFGGLLLSVRGALEYFNAEDKKILFSFLSAIFFFIASVVFYPFIKSYELNVINKSVPSFSSLFDIPLVLLFIIWFLATILLFRFKNKIIILLAGIITIVVYQFSNFF